MASEYHFESRKILSFLNNNTHSHEWMYSGLRHNPEFSDFTFIVGGREFEVHKIILSAHSPVFHKKFILKGRDRFENTEVIGDVTATTFSTFLDYIYTGKISREIWLSEAFELLEMAEKYQVKSLKRICVRLLVRFTRMHPDISFHIFQACYKLKASNQILRTAFQVVNNHHFDGELSPNSIRFPERLAEIMRLKQELETAKRKYEECKEELKRALEETSETKPVNKTL